MCDNQNFQLHHFKCDISHTMQVAIVHSKNKVPKQKNWISTALCLDRGTISRPHSIILQKESE